MFWKYNWQCNFRLIFFCSCGKMSHESFESMTPTHPMRSYFARRPSMNVPEETFFLAARCAPGCSVLYRWIVLSTRGSYKVSVDCTFASLMTSPVRKYRYLNYLILPIFTWWHLCEKTCGWKLYAFKSVSIRDDRLNDISARLQDWIELPRFLLNLSIIITLINLRTNIFISII